MTGDITLPDEHASRRTVSRRWLVDHPRAVPVAIFLLVLAITAISVLAIERGERQRDEARMSRTALAMASALERRASINASYLRAGAALFAMDEDVDAELFQRFVSELRIDTDYRGSRGIGWAPVITKETLPRFERELKALHGPQTHLAPSLAEQPRDKFVPVFYLQPPTKTNRDALGYDMYSNPVRRQAMDAAAASLRPTASGKIVLVQNRADGAPGFLIYMPVFSGSGDARRLKGFVYSPYNAQDFLSSAADSVDLNAMGIALYDGRPGPGTLMGSISNPVSGSAAVTQNVSIAHRPMVLVVSSARDGSLSLLSMLTLLFGLAVASLLMLVSRLLTQQAIEDQRTLDWFAEQNSIRNSLTRELNHRVKNTLANVLSIATLTRRRATSLDDYADGLDGRIRALSATHDLLTQSEWSTTPIAAVVQAELAPYAHDIDGALVAQGPPVELAPSDALSLGLALHELATNASKYGALSRAGGRVSVTWSLEEEGLARIDWVESGGPTVERSRTRGFGTDLIEKIVAHELRHPVNLVFAPEGVRCMLLVPVRQPSDFVMRAKPRGA